MLNGFRTLLCALVLLGANVSVAGELILKNGDRLAGDLVKLEGDKLVWQSESFGQLSIDKSKVDVLSTETLFKITGNESPCALLNMRGGDVSYSCRDGSTGQVPLLSVQDIQVYEEYHLAGWEYTGKALLSGSYERGNKVKDDLDADVDMQWRKGDWRHRVIFDYDSDALDNEPTVEVWRASYGGKWFFADQWYWYGDTSAAADDSKDIIEQYTLGTGLGYQIWETDITELSFEGGVIKIKERLRQPDDWDTSEPFETNNDRTSWKASSDFSYDFGAASFFNRNLYVQAFDDSGNWQLETDTGLSFPLMEVLTGELKFEYDVDNQPSDGNLREDKKLSIGVGYSW